MLKRNHRQGDPVRLSTSDPQAKHHPVPGTPHDGRSPRLKMS